jgi:predicted membrane-bound mannosyltransferase
MPPSRPDIIPIHGARRRQMWWAAGLAATLLLGIGIGRLSMHGGEGSSQRDTVAAMAPVSSTSTVVVAEPDTQGAGTTAGSATNPSTSSERPGRIPQQLAAASNASQRPGGTSASTQNAADRAAERRASQIALPYRLAASEHLAMTEALLVSLRADMKSGRRDTTVAAWATNLLGTTRMLLDSPASKDVQMKKLLEDLELVLAQIARLPAASGDSTDLELIDKAVKQRQVLTRLRAIEPRT